MDAERLPANEARLLSFEVGGELGVFDLVVLCEAAEKMYTALLTSRIARRLDGSVGAVADLGPQLGFVAEHLYELAPECVMRVESANFSSPGTINLEGSGEIIERLGEFAEKAYTRRELKEARKLSNDASRVEVDRARMELDRDREFGTIDVEMRRYEAARRIFLDLHGSDILISQEGRDQFAAFLAGASVLQGLAARGKIALSETATVPVPQLGLPPGPTG